MTDSTATYANMLNYANLIGSAIKAPVLVTSYYDYWAGRMKDYLIGLDKDLWRSVSEGPHTDIAGRFVVPDGEEAVVLNVADLKKIENDERAMRELRSGLGPDVSHHIADAKSAKEMWDNLELRFGGDKILHTSKVQEILADFGNFKQEENESLEACYERLSNMIYTLDNEMASSGSLALVSKEEKDSSDEDIAAYMVDDNGDTVALYATNNRRFKKPFFKNSSGKPFVKNFNKSNFKSKPKPEIFTPKEENSKLPTPKPSEKLTSESTKEKSEEKKISGDSGYDCNYCHGKNHFAKDCMLRKQNEKKPQVKDEAYYARKMEEVRVKTKDLALMAADDRQGSYQVWSSDSDDEEVRKPSHSSFIAYDADKCFLKDTSEEGNGEEKLDADVTSGLGFVTSEAHKMITAETSKTWIDDSSDDDEDICLMANDTRLTIPEQREVLTDQELLSLRERVESQKLALEKANLRICLLEENREKFLNNHDVILKQINIFCETAKRLYAHITRIYHSADVCNVQHRQLLPFIEFKLKEVDSISYECESIISGSEVTNPSYKHGLISREKHLTADNLLKILPQEIPILKKAVPWFETKHKGTINNNSDEASESDSDMEEIDCSSLTLLKSSSTSESHPEDISQLSSEDKRISKECCESKLTKIKETSKLKLQITDEFDSYDQFLKDDSKRLVKVACIYPKISYFKNTIFVKPGGLPLIDNELQKLLEKDNSTVTNEGFFSSSKMVENEINEKMEVKINVRKHDLYGHNVYNRLCFEKEKIPKNMSHLLNLKNDDHIYITQNYKQIQVVEKPTIPKLNVLELMESCECVPFSQNPENEVSKSKVFTDKTSVQQKPQILKRTQALQKSKPTVKRSKPTQKATVAKLKTKQTLNLVKRKTPFKDLKQNEAIASTSGTKPVCSIIPEVKNKIEKPSFTPTNPKFPNPKYQKPTKKSFSKGNNLIDTFHQWLDNNLDMFKDKNLSLNDFKMAYEEYLCTSTLCSSISKKSTNKNLKQNWRMSDLKENLIAKTNLSMSSKSSRKEKTLKSMKSTSSKQKWVPKTSVSSVFPDPSNLTKNSSEVCSDSSESCLSHETSKNLINLNANEISEEAVMSNERYDSKWYMDSGCSRHMTGKREYLRDYRTLDDAGNVRFGNNDTCPIRGYGKITNGQFTINRVAFVEGLKHNLVSISQLVVGTGNAVTFNDQGSIITKEATQEVLLKSERKGSMFPLNLKPVTGGQSLCLLSKANSDVSWCRLAHLNFKDLNKLVAMNLVRGMPALKFDNDSLCSACEHGKQTKQRHPTVINPKITEPLSLLYVDLCGPSVVESIEKKKYILVIVDDYSRFTWVLFLRNKSDAAEEIINFIRKMELMLNKKVRTVHSDNGSEFKNQTLDGFLKTRGTSHNFSAPYNFSGPKQFLLHASLKTDLTFTRDFTSHHTKYSTEENQMSNFFISSVVDVLS
ncbi:hypothetical protein L1887_40762 [Cichorium endivia]|nr:hypothetical protein L1887_40762 [Cichorium endivia]